MSGETFLTIASMRDTRRYADRPVAEEVLGRILEAGRLTGSARNEQRRRFHVLAERSMLDAAAEAVTRPANVLGAPLAIAITGPEHSWSGFDAGRAAQNMMVAAAADGIGSSPNTVKHRERVEALLDLDEDERVIVLVTFGEPRRPRDLARRSAEEWAQAADRLPLEQLVRRY